MKIDLKQWWGSLKPGQKRAGVFGGILLAVIGTGFITNSLQTPETPKKQKPSVAGREITMGDEEYRKASAENARHLIAENNQKMDQRIGDLEGMIRELEDKKTPPNPPAAPPLPSNAQSQPGYPAEPPPGAAPFPSNPQVQTLGQVHPQGVPRPVISEVGDAMVVHNPYAEEEERLRQEEARKADEGKKKAKHKIPAGAMMDAILLSGSDTPTMGEAANHPPVVELMIVDEAVLPNHIGLKDVLPGNVRASLKGCFLIATARGNLATERVGIRPHLISCISKNGKNVVEAKVEAWVSDVDGKNDAQGRPYSKNGQMLARAGMAGFIKGTSEAFSQSASIQSISALGTQQTVDAGKVGQAGLSKGASTAADKLADYYMKLSDQTLPVVEVLGNKRLTVHLEKAVELNIEEACVGLEGDMECTEDWE